MIYGLMNVRPFFSVVIPCYNCIDLLKRSITSVLNQTFQDFEIIIVDNSSTDGTGEYVKSICNERIIYEVVHNHGVIALSRNVGIKKARGNWVAFLDADDFWFPDKLEIVKRKTSENPHCDVFCHNEILLIQGAERNTLRYGPYEPDFYRILLTTGNRLSTSATTVRREFLNSHELRFNQARDYIIVEDYDLWLRIALKGACFFFIKQPLGKYIIEDGNISLNTTKMRHNQEVLLREHVYEIQDFEPDRDKLWRQIAVRLAVQYAKDLMAQRYVWGACMLIFTALKNSPLGGIKYFCSLVIRQTRWITQK